MPKKKEGDWDFMPSPEEMGKYVHEWIAVIDKKVVAHGKVLKPVYEQANEIAKAKNETPFFTWVVGGEEYVL